jgi:PAS domain S-box-containing protein
MYVECEVDFMTERSVESMAGVVIDLKEKKPIRVLHVDDEPCLLKIAKQCLEMEGHLKVDTACSVEEALNKLKEKKYDAVVSDYKMPGKDGLEFLKELRAKGNDIPFILFTGKGREEVIIKALNLGADHYVNKNGDPEAVYTELKHLISEIVGTRKAEGELQESQVRYRNLIENAPDVVYTISENGTLVSLNPAFERLTGWKCSEWIGKSFASLIHPDDLNTAMETFEKALHGECLPPYELRVRSKSGEYLIGEFTSRSWSEKGKIVGEFGIVRDVTGRKKAEEALGQSEEKYRNLVENSKDSVVVIDLRGNVQFANKATEELTGYNMKEGIGMNVRKITPLRYWPKSLAMLFQAKGGKPIPYFESVIKRKDGRLVSVESTGQAIIKNGKVVGLQIITRDISERKKIEEALRENMEGYRELAESISDMFFAMDKDFRYTYWNKASEEFTGISAKDAIGKSITEVFPDVRGTGVEQFYKKALRTQQPQTYLNKFQLRGKDYVFEINAYPTKTGLSVFVKDATERKKAEEALGQSEEKYRNLFENAKDVIVLFDLKGNVISVNKAAEEYGFNRSEMLGKNMLKFIAKRYWPKLLIDVAQIAQGKTAEGIIGIHTPKGDTIAEYRSNPVFSDNRVVGIQTFLKDATERKKAEEAVKESEEKYKDLFENAMDTILTLDLKGSVTAVNNSILRFGYKKEDLVGKRILDFVSKEYWPTIMRDLSQVTQGKSVKNETEIVVPTGKILVEYHARAIVKESNVTGVQINLRDVTERKKSEELLRESEERFRGLFESIRDPVGIFVGREGRLMDYNAAFKRLSGYTDEELKGKAFLDFVHPDDHALVLEKYQTEYSEEELPLVYEIRGMNKKGESLPLEISVSTYKKKDKVIGIEVIHREITERKRYERSLSTLNIHSLKLNTAKSMEEIYELTLDAAEKTLGFEFADVFMVKGKMLQLVTHRGKTEISSLSLPMDGDRGISVRAARTGKLVLIPDISKEEAYVEGEEGARSELAVPITIGTRVLGVLNVESRDLDAFNKRDQELLEILASHAATAISNLDHARELEAYALEIRETKQKFEGLFLSNPEATVYLAPDFRILDINQRFEELLGHSLSEIKGKHIDDVIVPKDKMKEAKMLDGKAVEGYVYHDTFRMRKDGSLVPVSISAAPIKVENRLIGYIGVYKDISDLKKIEKNLEEMNEKLQVVGQLTRHDVRNKLSTITGNVYLLKKQLASNSEILDKLRDMETAVQQVTKIFDFAKAYEMLGAEKLVYIDVGKTVDEAVTLFPDLKGVKMTHSCQGLTVLADSLLRQLFYNLIDNSLKYGQEITKIRTRCQQTSQGELRLIYEDDGVGIPETEKPKLFKQGYSTGGSTGYGLYLIRKMIEVYGWTIQETGTPCKGAQFTITIPKTNQTREENYRLQGA